MKPKKRRMIAYIAGRLATRKEAHAIYDHDAKGYFQAAGDCNAKKISVYDYDRKCHLVGVFQGPRLAVYDHGSKSYVELKMKGKKFEGYDFESKIHYGGEITEQGIAFYDFQDKKHHWFVI